MALVARKRANFLSFLLLLEFVICIIATVGCDQRWARLDRGDVVHPLLNLIRSFRPHRIRRTCATIVMFAVALGMSTASTRAGNTFGNGESPATQPNSPGPGLAPMPPALLLADDAKPDDSPPFAPSAPDDAESAARLPVPVAVDQEKARKSFAQQYATQLADHTPSGCLALSAQLLIDAAKASDHPVNEYVLLTEARRVGIASGDLATAQNADKALCAAFNVDAQASRLDLLDRLSERSLAPADRAELAKAALKEADQALDKGAFHLAAKFADTAVPPA
jgi:hypothetical protein